MKIHIKALPISVYDLRKLRYRLKLVSFRALNEMNDEG